MGLDNGILLKIKDRDKFGKLPKGYEIWFDDTIEILYWRKCWNIRSYIFDFLNDKGIKTVTDCSEDSVMSLDDLKELLKGLKHCYKRKWWEENNDTIWEFDDIKDNFKDSLACAKSLVKWIKDKDPDSYEISFYDSY